MAQADVELLVHLHRFRSIHLLRTGYAAAVIEWCLFVGVFAWLMMNASGVWMCGVYRWHLLARTVLEYDWWVSRSRAVMASSLRCRASWSITLRCLRQVRSISRE